MRTHSTRWAHRHDSSSNDRLTSGMYSVDIATVAAEKKQPRAGV